ncbi:hypothetical protein FTO74_16640 [Granulicella sp. WH15]|uniref:hypothetical protein n=1 Tax=Granulicella sp. WH15 TaxID=2602070 RepID=UPI001367382D|nr:hypothetical protein [Granulicella sp. WH15]QHN04804.1 hypothetical protein FTO74_16640 [Granulicella sp. WH15]
MHNILVFLPAIFPFDPAIDTPLGHRNLVLIYDLTWGLQFGYAVYAIYTWRVASRQKPPQK